VKKTITIC